MNAVEKTLRQVTKAQAKRALKQKTYFKGVSWRSADGLG